MIKTHITEERSTYISSDEETRMIKQPNVFPLTNKMRIFEEDCGFTSSQSADLELLMKIIDKDLKFQLNQKSFVRQNLKRQILQVFTKISE